MKRLVHFRPTGIVIGFFMIAFLVSGCGDGGGNGNGGGGDGDDGGGGGLQPTLSSIWLNVFSMTCVAGCHQPGGIGFAQTGSGLDLSSKDVAFNSMVDVDAFESQCGLTFTDPCGKRVDPFDTENSYLINKLEGNNLSLNTSQMPLNAPPWDQETIDVIRQWIMNGAEDN